MYKQRISYADYVEEVERLYKIERREIYFGFVTEILYNRSLQKVNNW